MILRTTGRLVAALMAGLLIAACQEQLTGPGSCPATCPGGTPTLRDTVLEALPGEDALYSGYYISGGTGTGVRVANGLLGHTDYAVIRFIPRLDSIRVRDTARTYTIDSVSLQVTLLARDTLASGIRLALHRLPATVDTTVTFAAIDPLIVDGTLIDSVTIADSIRKKFTYVFKFTGGELAQVAIPAGDSGVFAMAVAISGPTATGLRIGGLGSFDGVPLIKAWVTVDVPDTATAIRQQILQNGPAFTRYVTSAPDAAPDSTVLALGGRAGSRAYIRFPWPAYLRDTALLARATLELVPESPFTGLAGDSVFVRAFGVRVDFGAKSPIAGNGFLEPLALGSADTVRIDVVPELKLWQADRLPHPPLFMVRVDPEDASFTEPRFYSTRAADPARRPRLRITYQLPFDFERP